LTARDSMISQQYATDTFWNVPRLTDTVRTSPPCESPLLGPSPWSRFQESNQAR
jgi:hypothetical protein